MQCKESGSSLVVRLGDPILRNVIKRALNGYIVTSKTCLSKTKYGQSKDHIWMFLLPIYCLLCSMFIKLYHMDKEILAVVHILYKVPMLEHLTLTSTHVTVIHTCLTNTLKLYPPPTPTVCTPTYTHLTPTVHTPAYTCFSLAHCPHICHC